MQAAFLLAAAALLAATGFLPLFAGPGYEAALAAGLILPSLVAIATALDVAASQPEPIDALGRGIARGALYAGVALLLTLVHGLRVGFCDFVGDTTLFLLGGGFGAVMGGAWGAAAGLIAGRLPRARLLAVLLALAGPAGGIAVSLLRFYTSPMVFAFDPFFGLFAGPLYDTVIDRTSSLLSYRAGSWLTLAAAAVLAQQLGRGPTGRLVLWPVRRRGLVALGALAALGSSGLTWFGAELGHFSTTASIRAALGRETSFGRCDVVYSSAIRPRDAELVAQQCHAHLVELERYFDHPGPTRCRVLLFASAQEKAALVGAGHTHIAKPWRAEVYIQGTTYPHPVLRHELAHVVAGAFAPGPLHVAGPWHGLVPDPGRIEGIAVAAAPDEDSDLTLQQWARTLLDLGRLPPLHTVFALGFLGENSATAYTVAGAFVDHVYRRYGAAAVRGWYGGADLRAVTGRDLDALEAEWRATLAGVVVPPEALHAARALFERPALFGRRCPRVVDRLGLQAQALLGAGDAVGARDAYQALLRLDPLDSPARLGLGACARSSGDDADARARFTELATDPRVVGLEQAAARELLADLDLVRGAPDAARAGYREVARVTVDGDHLRTLELKQNATAGPARRAVAALLVGDPREGPNFGVAAARLGFWAALAPDDGTPHYLLGRNFFLQGQWAEAAAELDAALGRTIELPRLRREAPRLRAVLACAQGDRARARAAYARYLGEPGESVARREGMQRFAARCGI